MSTKVIKPGLSTTLVDSGRTGYRRIGIGPGGAMDCFAMNIANGLVGNELRSATLEIHFPSPEFMFQHSHVVAVCGKGFDVRLNNELVPLWRPFLIGQGSTLKFERASGGRAYLAVRGGWKAREWLGSLSTHTGIHAGGFDGRPLQKGDVLEISETFEATYESKVLPWGISRGELDAVYLPSHEIRCLSGPEATILSNASRETFFMSTFTIGRQSNRMGYRLEGPPLRPETTNELVSSPVDAGTIQLFPDGNITILMADHQTSGGYPRIGSVLKADLPKLAQLMPGEEIRFKSASFLEAESELQAMEIKSEELIRVCLLQFKKFFHHEPPFHRY
jgi:antagonist of KipI